jgi:two-component system sensor histidine kinase BaeS
MLFVVPPAAGLVGGAIAYFGARRAFAPLGNITRAAHLIGNGSVAERAPVEGDDEIQELAQAVNVIAEKFQYVDEHRRSLLAEVTHELRRPLNNVQGYAEMVQQQVLSFADTIQHSTAAMHRQIEALSRQVDDLRILADADSGDLVLKQQPDDLRDVLMVATEGYERRARDHGVVITRDAPSSLPPVYVDRARIYQVIGNLLDNALAHMPDGGEIKISAAPRDSMVLITVRDTGSGIPANALPHIFERFYSADTERSRKSGGFGLGLTVARQIIESHGGRIWVKSEENKGSTFFLTVPVHDSAHNRPLPAPRTLPTQPET